MAKLILAALVAYAGWWLWQGPKKSHKRRPAPARTPGAEPTSAAEARAILGVDADADDEAIRAAHRRLIRRVHPDAGGSDAATQRVNRARDLLLRTTNR